jgi:hypothetical protein
MHPRRGFNNRLHDCIPTEGGDVADLICLFIRWLITAVVNVWQS